MAQLRSKWSSLLCLLVVVVHGAKVFAIGSSPESRPASSGSASVASSGTAAVTQRKLLQTLTPTPTPTVPATTSPSPLWTSACPAFLRTGEPLTTIVCLYTFSNVPYGGVGQSQIPCLYNASGTLTKGPSLFPASVRPGLPNVNPCAGTTAPNSCPLVISYTGTYAATPVTFAQASCIYYVLEYGPMFPSLYAPEFCTYLSTGASTTNIYVTSGPNPSNCPANTTPIATPLPTLPAPTMTLAPTTLVPVAPAPTTPKPSSIPGPPLGTLTTCTNTGYGQSVACANIPTPFGPGRAACACGSYAGGAVATPTVCQADVQCAACIRGCSRDADCLPGYNCAGGCGGAAPPRGLSGVCLPNCGTAPNAAGC